MRALVTGGAGFIGSYLIPRLLEKGMEVVVFDMAKEPAALEPVKDRITYVRGDLASEADLYRVMMSHKITDVYHLGVILAGPCEENPIYGFKINFHATQTLLDASVALGVNRFFMMSSISVFGRDVSEPVPDDALKNPETVYGQTKLACEHQLRWYHRKHGLDTRALRFAWVFGPGRTRGITALYSSLILDAIGAILTLWDAEDPKQRIYNIAGGVHSIGDVVKIAKRIKPESSVTLVPQGAAQSPYPAAYDDRVARSEIGWEPKYTIEAAVREHIDIVSRGS